MSKTPKLDKFCNDFQIDKKVFNSNSIEGNAKSVDSIKDKLERKLDLKSSFTLAEFNDLSRCVILLDSYEQIPDFLRLMKERIPSLVGDVPQRKSGYRGVHTHFRLGGINVEVQLSTAKAWTYKRAEDEVYKDLRSRKESVTKKDLDIALDLIIELKRNMSSNNSKDLTNQLNVAKENYQHLKHIYDSEKSEIEEKRKESRDLYEELHADGEFDKIKNEAAAFLLVCSMDAKPEKKHPEFDSEDSFLHEKVTKDAQGNIDTKQLEEVAEIGHGYASGIQPHLLGMMTQILEESKFKNARVIIVDEKSVKFVNEVFDIYDQSLQKMHFDRDKILDRIEVITNQKIKIGEGSLGYAREKRKLNDEVFDVLMEYYNHLKAKKDPMISENYAIIMIVNNFDNSEDKNRND